MDDLMKLVRAYRFAPDIEERIRIAGLICPLLSPQLSLFIRGFVQPPNADDVLQDSMKAIIGGLRGFKGTEVKQVWKWCYQITRRKIADFCRSAKADRLQPMEPDELNQLLQTSAQAAPGSPAVWHDLEYALNVLLKSKPECYDFLWQHYIVGLDYADIAAEQDMTYDSARMKVGRCLSEAQKLVSQS